MCVGDGFICVKIHKMSEDLLCDELYLLLVGRSEAALIVGFAFWISVAIVEGRTEFRTEFNDEDGQMRGRRSHRSPPQWG